MLSLARERNEDAAMSNIINSQNQNRIINAVGADDWDVVIHTFAGLRKLMC
jgi:hypothetical protein